MINKLFAVANTLGEEQTSQGYNSCSKAHCGTPGTELEGILELRVDTDGDQGFVLLPTPEEPDKE